MKRKERKFFVSCVAGAGLAFLILGCCTFARAGTAYFAQAGVLLAFDGSLSRTVSAPIAEVPAAQPKTISKYWGALADGALVISLGEAKVDESHYGGPEGGTDLALLRADGTLESVIARDALRAYPAPVGRAIAVITADRHLAIYRDGRLHDVAVNGRVSNLAWSPDARRLVASMYPPDWSPDAVNNARTTEDFLRLQNSDLWLLDAEKPAPIRKLTNDPGTEYGAFFSTDGRDLYYIWLHVREDQGGLMKLTLDLDDATSASASPVQLTHAGNDAGEVPLGRVGTYLRADGGRQLVFEAGVPDGSGEIWAMSSDGSSAQHLASGRHPQSIGEGRFGYVDSVGKPQVLQVTGAK
jgi:hypothetical protein